VDRRTVRYNSWEVLGRHSAGQPHLREPAIDHWQRTRHRMPRSPVRRAPGRWPQRPSGGDRPVL